MCITIPSSANIDRSRQLPVWSWLTDSPDRLLPFGGLISMLPGLLQMLFGKPHAEHWLVFNLLFGITPFFLFGVLLAQLPGWLKVTPLRYVSYGMLFFLMLITQLVFQFSMLSGGDPGVIYMLLMLLSWAVLLNTLNQFRTSSYIADRSGEERLFFSLLWGVTIGSAVALSLSAGWLVSWLPGLIAGLSYLLPLSLFYLVIVTKHRS